MVDNIYICSYFDELMRLIHQIVKGCKNNFFCVGDRVGGDMNNIQSYFD